MNLAHTRTNEVTLIAKWDKTENFGTAHLVKTELEKRKENAGLHNRKHVASTLIDSILTDAWTVRIRAGICD
jgi:hypothetical protein